MSRICGIVAPTKGREERASALAMQVAAQLHSTGFRSTSAHLAGASLGCVFFPQNNLGTDLAQFADDHLSIVFSGYLSDKAVLANRVRTESHGRVPATTAAEIVGYLFTRHGPEILANLNGCFVFALWQDDSQTLSLGTDRWGLKPLYYRQQASTLTFASEIGALLAGENDLSGNLAATHELFTLGAPIGDHTLYPSIFRLPPATVLTFRDGRLANSSYWDFGRVRGGGPTDINEFVAEMRRLFGLSMGKLLSQVNQPICMLSSGFDSRRILLEMLAQNRTSTAYTASIIQPEGGFEIDTSVAGALCREFGVPHVHSDLPAPTEQARMVRQTYQLLDYETDAHAWIMPLLPRIAMGGGINFDGSGGDVLEDGNFTFDGQAEHIDDPAWLANSVIERFPDLWSSHFSHPAPEPPLAVRIADEIRKLPVSDHRFTMFYFMNWTRRKTALFSQRLLSLKLDSVYPFLDYDLVEFLLSVPPLWKRAHTIRRAYLENVNADLLARLPSSHLTDIFLRPEPKWQSFCLPVAPDHQTTARASLYRSAGYDILRSPGVFRQASRQTRLAALALAIPGPSSLASERLTGRAWTLRLMGLYAQHRRVAAHPAIAKRLRDDAYRYIYTPQS